MIRKSLVLIFISYFFVYIKSDDGIESAGNPLFLTTYIETERIDEAKEKASVKHPQMKNVESYAGYLTINEEFNSNTFFWYFPSQANPKNDPLLIWMNGGPGTTSLLGLFVENGPFIVTENGTLETRKYSWNTNHNIIYIDNPVGTGYSFTESNMGYVKHDEEVGDDVLIALIQFFKLFPELKTNDFYVIGESYAGKYVPAVCHAIKIYNQNAESKINLKGLAIGDGLTDPINQLTYYSDTLHGIGLLNLEERDEIQAVEDEVRALLKQEKYVEASRVRAALFSSPYSPIPTLIKNMTGFDYYYNYLQTKRPTNFNRYIDLVTRSDVRRALHVGTTQFNSSSQIVNEYLGDDFLKSAAYLIPELLEDYKVLIYHGQWDFIVSYIGTEKFIASLNWTGAGEYKTSRKEIWQIEDDVAGYWKAGHNLNFVLVRNAGHHVPTDQPLWAWDMITRFTRNHDF